MKELPASALGRVVARLCLLLLFSGVAVPLFAQAPVITSPPLTKMVIAGQSVSFSVSATGAAPLSYRWSRNGQVIPNATSPTLVILTVALSDAGYYRALVTNNQGSASSIVYASVAPASATVVGWGSNLEGQITIPTSLGSVLAADVGTEHSLALKSDGTVAAWGYNYYRQCNVPPGLSGVVAISGGGVHSVALKGDGTIVAWGDSTYNQTSVPAGLNGVVAISAGYNHTLALRGDGTVVAWGKNEAGQCDVPAGLADIVAISGGYAHSLALRSDSTVVAWGSNFSGQSNVPAGLSGVVAISTSSADNLVLKADGTVLAWGDNLYGESSVPAGLGGVIAVSAGGTRSIALKNDGTLAAWGDQPYADFSSLLLTRQVTAVSARGDHVLALIPLLAVAITTQPTGQTIAAGGSFTASIVVSGTLPTYQWFRNGQQLVNDPRISGAQTATLTIANVDSPDAANYTVVVTNPMGSVTSAAAALVVTGGSPLITSRPLSQRVNIGQSVTFAVGASNNDGGALSYQWKHNAQVITGATSATLNISATQASDRGFYEVAVANAGGGVTKSFFALDVTIGDGAPIGWGVVGGSTPATAPAGMRGLVAVAAGDEHIVGLKNDGTVVAWGANSSFGETTIPTNLNNVVAIAAGAAHTVALVADGTVVAWGGNWNGQRNVPLGLSNVVRIFAGSSRSAALKADGSIVSWGDNIYTSDRPANLGPVVDLVLGETHTIALRPDGTLIGWGRADSGELNIPSGLNSVIALTGRLRKSFAVRANGTVAAWGVGAPSIPSDLSNVQAVASGGSHDLMLKADGTLVQFGSLPAPTGLAEVVAISAGTNCGVVLVPARAPLIDIQPATQRIVPGGTATFNVSANGPLPISYQWQFYGRPIAGATNSTLTVANAQTAQSGEYSVVVSNSFGSATSNAALLTGLNPAPTITNAPQPVSVTADQDLTLSVAASGTGSLTYQWRRDGTALPGATAATLDLGPAVLAMNGSYDVLIVDGLSFTLSPSVAVQVAPSAYAQVVSVDPNISAAFEDSGGYVDNFVRLADGKVLVVGEFSRVHGSPGRNIGRLKADGSGDATFVPTAIDGTVQAAAVQSDGKIIIGGAFRNVGGQPRSGLARLSANGTLDTSFMPATDFYGVFALAVQPSGQIVLGGTFISRLARVNGDGATDSAFGPAPNGAVYALLALADGRIVAGGSFTQIAGQSSSGVARLNADGSRDGTFAVGAGFNGPVYALRLLSGDRVLAGGAFTGYGGNTANRIVRISNTGAPDPGWSSGSGFNSDVYALDVRSDGKILAAGAFGGFNGVAITAVALLDANGARDTTFRPLTFTRVAGAVTYLDNGSVLAGGSFTLDGGPGVFVNGIALLNNAGTVLFDFAPGLMQPSSVATIVRLADGRVIAGGPFIYVNGISAPYLARLNVDGSLDTTFTTNVVGRPNLPVDAMLVQPDGRIVIVGAFGAYKSTFISKVARINSDGSIDAGFRPGDGMSATPDRILPMPGGRLLLAAKSLPAVYGSPPRRDTLIVVKPDGAIDTNFAATPVPAGEINALVVQPDGKIVVGGSFRSFNGAPCDFVVRLLPSGARDPSFSTRTDDVVRALALQPDGKIVLAGDFLAVNDTARARVARVQTAGELDPAFNPQFALNGSPTLVQMEPGGRILLSGNFDSVSNHPVLRYLIRVQPTGALDYSFAAPGLTSPIADLALAEDGALWLAGGDLQIRGVPREGLLRTVSASGPIVLSQPPSRTSPAGAAVTLSMAIAGGENVTYQWLKNGAAIPGATNPNLSFPSAQTTDSGSYIVRVFHGGGSFDSVAATLTVNPSAPILAASDITGFGGAIKSGSRWALTAPPIMAGSLPIAYQWAKDGIPIAGATSRTLLIPSWQSADAGIYQVAVGNSVGTVLAAPFAQQVTATPDWDWHLPLPQGNSLLAMVYLNGRFLGGGGRGTVLTSTDGGSWTVTRLGVSNTILGFAHGNGTYVALSSFGGVWTSSDAVTWTQRDTGTGRDGRYFSALAFGAGRFIGVGDRGLIASSTNGAAWSIIDGGTADSLGAVASGNGKFVALAAGGRTLVSIDGLSWSAGAIIPRPVTSIAYGAGRFVAAIGNQLFVSTDGQIWFQKTLDPTSSITALQFTDVGFLATLDSTNGKYLSSMDGINWTEQTTGLTLNAAATALAHGANRSVMAGLAPETLITSADGSTWTRITAAETLNFTAVAASSSSLLAVGSHGAARIFSDGTVSIRPLEFLSLNRPADIAFGANKYVVVFDAGDIWTSADGATWSGLTNSSQSYSGVSFVNDRFFVLGTNGLMLTSPAATSWTTVSTGTVQTLLKTAFGADTYVTVGANGTVLSSTDSATWTARSANGITTNISDVIFAAGKFVLISDGGSIRTSSDGITWTPQTNPLGAGLKSVVHTGERFFAATTSNTNYLVSPDGVTWTAMQHGNANTSADLVVFGNRVYLVGTNGSIVSAPAGVPVIAVQPGSQSKLAGDSVTLGVSASGGAPFAYQWARNGVALAGATSSSLTLSNLTAANAGNYTVMVTNAAGVVTSSAAVLTVGPVPGTPSITTPPASQSVVVGGNVTFTVVATGTAPLAYQWQKNGTPVNSATNASLTLTDLQPADAADYRVTISNSIGNTTSAVATLIVLTPPVITAQPVAQVAIAGSSATFTVAATNPGAGSLTYRWYFTPAGSLTPQALTDQTGKLSGAQTASLTVSNIQTADTGDYVCVVSNSDGLAASNAAPLSLAARVVRIVSQTVAPGATVVVPVQLLASGNEDALTFSVIFDPAQLTYQSAVVGAQAADATLNPNATQATSGRLGFALAKPAGVVWTAGTQEVLKITFTLNASLANGTVASLTFGDSPVAREVSSATAGALPADYQSGSVTVLAGYEADMNGNGTVSITDWVKVGRIVAGLDPAPTGVDFMKADCAPRSTLGNGTLSVTDWVQAGRYAAGLDPLTAGGGPSAPNP